MPKFDPADPLAYVLELAWSDPDKAEDILREHFCRPVDGGGQPNQRVLEYLSLCFHAIQHGVEADLALGIRRTRGQHRQRTLEAEDEERLEWATEVVRLRQSGECLSDDEAVRIVADRRGKDVRTIREAYGIFGQFARNRI